MNEDDRVKQRGSKSSQPIIFPAGLMDVAPPASDAASIRLVPYVNIL